MTFQSQLLFAIGLGYSALALARQLDEDEWLCAGTVRSEEKVETLRLQRIAAMVWDGTGEAPYVPKGAHLLITLPPDDDGCPAARAIGSAAAQAASVTYLSTTGVYGDLNGGWAFEWSGVNPQSARSARRVLAEQQWTEATDGRARIVRLPGIYGPGRSPFDRLRKGKATRVVKEGQVFSRIHVDDIASGLAALVQRPYLSGVFHLCDDEAAPPQDVTVFAADLLDIAPPPEQSFDDAEMSDMARSFYSECKRVSNARTKAALEWRLKYPTYREGLQAVLEAEA